MKVYDTCIDKVVNSIFVSGKSDYSEGIDKLVPLINKYAEQRNSLSAKFYDKLKRDIEKGCVMPPLTIAIIDENQILLNSQEIENDKIEEFINTNIENAFILDGIQRLSTLNTIPKENLELSRPLYVNVLISNSKDNFLYRMITLNNGQKPMSARHQIEILAGSIYDFDKLNLEFRTEKEAKISRKVGVFKKEIIIKGYMAFLTRSYNMDNTKIIESKMDELIFGKIMERPPTEMTFQFEDIIDLISKYLDNKDLLDWFKVENNFIGFCSAMSVGYEKICKESDEVIVSFIYSFEAAFKGFNVSKINLGVSRRKSVNYVFEKFDNFLNLSPIEILDELSQVV